MKTNCKIKNSNSSEKEKSKENAFNVPVSSLRNLEEKARYSAQQSTSLYSDDLMDFDEEHNLEVELLSYIIKINNLSNFLIY